MNHKSDKNLLGVFSNSREIDTLFSILSNECRLYALYCLQQYRNPMALADVAVEVYRLESNEQTAADISKEDVKQIYTNLYHTHIPKLSEADLVEYDHTEDTVTLNDESTVPDVEEVISVINGG